MRNRNKCNMSFLIVCIVIFVGILDRAYLTNKISRQDKDSEALNEAIGKIASDINEKDAEIKDLKDQINALPK